ncbi:cytochrome c maturation protein CcmE [Erythrobacter sp. W53]|uniref:cytochrome c maturation protein CcmE n=1 Tax=Erythrobacteraceae TaxID=335929 RepID=UPI0036D30242
MSTLKPKHQRLALGVLALIAIIGAGLIAVYGLQNQANYFYFPEQMRDNPPEVGQPVRLGGMVQEGSLETLPDGITLAFVVTGQEDSSIPVRFSGIIPDLFVEGSGVVADGSLDADGVFIADNLLAKHDENYVPRELEGMAEHQAAQSYEQTTIGLD